MRKAFRIMRKVAGTGALFFGAASLMVGGYVLVSSLADVKRYIRISTM